MVSNEPVGSCGRLRLVFMGSPDFAVPTLRALAEHHELVAVVTQPDRPRGRGRGIAAPPVKLAALELGIEALQPQTLRRKSERLRLAAFAADAFVVAAFGQILSPRLLKVPPLGCINVHASLLPRLRGAAPIHWAVLRGEQRSGVTIMQMDAGVDTGPMLLQRGIDLRPDETAGSLHDRLAPLGADLLLEALGGLQRGTVAPAPQDEQQATHAPMLSKASGAVDFERSAAEVDRWVRGMDPWPGAFCQLDGARLRLFGAAPGAGQGPPGQILDVDDRGMLVACGAGAVWIRELQAPGRRRMAAQAFFAGRQGGRGARLGRG